VIPRVARDGPKRPGPLAALVLLCAVAPATAFDFSPGWSWRSPASPPALADVLAHGRRDIPKVALTFDACTGQRENHFDGHIVQDLLMANAPATFFLGGGWMRARADAVRNLATLPQMELGIHGWYHERFPRLSDARVNLELARTAAELVRLTGRRPTLFRPPYGTCDARTVRLARGQALTTVSFDVPSGDPDPRVTRQDLTRWVVRRAQAGSIIVFHINGRGWHTAEALPDIIHGLRARGFALVTVGELLRESAQVVVDQRGRAAGGGGGQG
jgi:peptidoglycan/xylan/chitin deacetylase (PgdA/CDA1 family)